MWSSDSPLSQMVLTDHLWEFLTNVVLWMLLFVSKHVLPKSLYNTVIITWRPPMSIVLAVGGPGD